MFGISNLSLLIVLITCTVIYCQHDYDYYDSGDSFDYLIGPFPNRPRYNRNGRMGQVSYYSEGDVNSRGVVGQITGIISSGKCVILCVSRNLKNCDGLIGCIWRCFSTETKPNFNQDDSDISVGPPSSPNSDKITPNDLVRLVICMVRCLVRYLPRSKGTLQRFGTCWAVRCVCADG